MKKTVLKCVAFSSSVFLLIHAVATLGYCKIINEDWSVALQVILLVAALPLYFFVKRKEEKLFAYPLLMATFVACAFGISWIVFFNFTAMLSCLLRGLSFLQPGVWRYGRGCCLQFLLHWAGLPFC